MILSFPPQNAWAQLTNKNERAVSFDLRSDTTKPEKYIPLKDLADVIKLLVNKTKKPDSDTIISGPVLSIIPAIGYSLQTKLAGVISGNVAFRANKESRLSAISGNITYTQNKQFYIPIQSNIWTKGNKYNLVGDFRFYKYPQSTFGLGSGSTSTNEDPMDYKFARFYQVFFLSKKIITTTDSFSTKSFSSKISHCSEIGLFHYILKIEDFTLKILVPLIDYLNILTASANYDQYLSSSTRFSLHSNLTTFPYQRL